MHVRIMTNGSLMLALLTGLSLSQSDSTKPTTYTLEPIKVSNAIYPEKARKKRIQGKVAAMMLVSETGDVEKVEIFKADAILSQAVQEAIREWKFKPVTKDGSAVPVIAKATLTLFSATRTSRSLPKSPQLLISRSRLGLRMA